MLLNMEDKLRKYLAGDHFQARQYSAAGFTTILRTQDDSPWELSREKVEKILHDYAPELSAVVDGPVIVIFLESK